MKRQFLTLLLLPILLTSCAMQADRDLDRRADDVLGVGAEEDERSAQRALEELHQSQREEQRKQLERQITDPAPGSLNG